MRNVDTLVELGSMLVFHQVVLVEPGFKPGAGVV